MLAYFNKTLHKKYFNNLKSLWINKLSDRYNPEKSIWAIAAYLKYISLVKKIDLSSSLAKYNIWPFWTIWSQKHLNNNPAINQEFYKMYWRGTKITERRVYLAAKQYYNKFI